MVPGFPTRRCVLLTTAALLAALPLFALGPQRRLSQYIHQAWTSNEGLPQESVNQIVQTPDGYLWLATQEGVARFDGVSFTTFDSRNNPGFDTNFIHALFVDRTGTLWIGASDGLIRYDGKDKFTPFGMKEGLPGMGARYISQGPDESLWLGFGTGRPTGGKGLLQFRNGRARSFTTADGLPGDQVYETWTDRSGTLWIGTGNGLAVMKNGAVLRTYTTAEGLPHDLVRVVHEDRAGKIWLGTPSGLARFDGQRFETFTTSDGLLSDSIEAIHEDRDGILWIATGKGVNRYLHQRFEAAEVEGLRNDRVLSIFEDRERSLWIGTHSSGLHRLRAGKFTPWGLPEGLAGQAVQGILEDRAGRLWMGTSPGGINALERGEITSYSPAEGFPSNNAKAFFEDRAGVLWIGTSDGLVGMEGGRFQLYGTGDGIPHLSINVIAQDRAGTLWVGTNLGLARRSGETFAAVPLPGAPAEVRVIHEDVRGRLLVGGGDGIGFVEKDRFVPLLPGALGKANVMALHEDRDGTLWIATWGSGLFRLHEGKAMRFTSRHGLYDDTIWSIVDDGRGNLWMGSNRGIFRVPRQQFEEFSKRRQSLTCDVYNTSNGMRRRETNAGSPAAIRDRKGKLWFGTTGGAVSVDPSRIVFNSVPPNVVIEHFVVNEHEIAPFTPLSLAAGSRSLEVHYAALSLVAPSRVRYRYKLDGFDDHWVDVGPRRSAYYTNVDPGIYTFRVTAANEDGVWSPAGASITFRIAPFFYQTWWFYASLVAGVVLLALVIFVARKQQKEIRHRVYHDPLTGLPNRVLLSERAEVALKQASRHGRSIAVLFLDLDGFKGVNDRFGHAGGDELLQLVADRLRSCIREVDTLARIGGDEFAALVAEIEDESRAAEVARRMIDAVRKGFTLRGQDVPLGVSIGIAFHPFDGTDIPTILQSADRAMYRAKLAGGNAYQYNAADRDEVITI